MVKQRECDRVMAASRPPCQITGQLEDIEEEQEEEEEEEEQEEEQEQQEEEQEQEQQEEEYKFCSAKQS